MRSIRRVLRTSAVAVTACLVGLALAGTASVSAQAPDDSTQPRPTILLVHGAWADGSSWAAVTAELQRHGLTVHVVPNPLRGVASDARYLKDHLATVSGPIVLVGHSYAGMVITSAAAGNANVRGLVYVNAYIPQQGETVQQLTGAQPGSELDPNTSIDPVPLHDAGGNLVAVDLYIKQALFPRLFAADVPDEVAGMLAASQRPLTLSALSEEFSGPSAWETIPSWVLVGTADRVLPQAQQEAMATRADAEVVEVDAPHLSMISDPDAVADLITTAARGR